VGPLRLQALSRGREVVAPGRQRWQQRLPAASVEAAAARVGLASHEAIAGIVPATDAPVPVPGRSLPQGPVAVWRVGTSAEGLGTYDQQTFEVPGLVGHPESGVRGRSICQLGTIRQPTRRRAPRPAVTRERHEGPERRAALDCPGTRALQASSHRTVWARAWRAAWERWRPCSARAKKSRPRASANASPARNSSPHSESRNGQFLRLVLPATCPFIPRIPPPSSEK
jgi:hypothetical protein